MKTERGFIDEIGQWVPEGAASVGSILSPTEVILRSQITPEMRINITDLQGSMTKKSSPPGFAGKAVDWFLSSVVRPEVEINVFGAPHRIAPWGKPEKNRSALLTLGLLSALAGAGYMGYRFLKG